MFFRNQLCLLFLIFLSSKNYSQVNLNWSDGSKYLTGNSDLEFYYLYTANGDNGLPVGQIATCSMWGLYITVYNKSNRDISIFANVTVNGSGNYNCGDTSRSPVNCTIKAKGSKKVRITPDIWTPLNIRPNAPNIQWEIKANNNTVDVNLENTYKKNSNEYQSKGWVKLPDGWMYKKLPNGMYSFFDGFDQIETIPASDFQAELERHKAISNSDNSSSDKYSNKEYDDSKRQMRELLNQYKQQLREIYRDSDASQSEINEMEHQIKILEEAINND